MRLDKRKERIKIKNKRIGSDVFVKRRFIFIICF